MRQSTNHFQQTHQHACLLQVQFPKGSYGWITLHRMQSLENASTNAAFSTCSSTWGCSHFFAGVTAPGSPPSGANAPRRGACIEVALGQAPQKQAVQKHSLAAGVLVWSKVTTVSSPLLHLEAWCGCSVCRRPVLVAEVGICGRRVLFPL